MSNFQNGVYWGPSAWKIFISSSWGRERGRFRSFLCCRPILHYTQKAFLLLPLCMKLSLYSSEWKKYRHGDWWSMPNCVGPIYRTRCGQGSSMYLNRSKIWERLRKNVGGLGRRRRPRVKLYVSSVVGGGSTVYLYRLLLSVPPSFFPELFICFLPISGYILIGQRQRKGYGTEWWH